MMGAMKLSESSQVGIEPDAPSRPDAPEAADAALAVPTDDGPIAPLDAAEAALAQASDAGDPVVLVVHASVGSGHRSAAYAIAEALEEAGDAARAAGNDDAPAARARVEVLDILDFGRIVFDGDATASMFTGWTRPFYDLTWRYTLTGRLLWGGGTIWAHIMYPRFVEFVRRVRPTAIVATQDRKSVV